MYDNLPECIRKLIKKPFVFISYSHKNALIFNRVHNLVLYLRQNGVNVIYDEGGLPAGTDIEAFMQLIFCNNCNKVFVVVDDCYLYSVENQTGGAYEEYIWISRNYTSTPLKYIPLQDSSRTLPLLKGTIYLQFNDDNSATFKSILDYLKKNSKCIRKKKAIKKTDLDNELTELSRLYDSKDYLAVYNQATALEKKVANTINNSSLAQIYNYQLIAEIKLNKKVECLDIAKKLLNIIHFINDYEKKAIYYLNCSLAYRANDNWDQNEEYAREASNFANKGGLADNYLYTINYATALYNLNKFSDAYLTIKEAQKEFEKAVTNEMGNNEINDWVKIKGNLASFAIKYGKENIKNSKEKSKYFREAREAIRDVLNYTLDNELDDVLMRNVYDTASEIYGELRDSIKID